MESCAIFITRTKAARNDAVGLDWTGQSVKWMLAELTNIQMNPLNALHSSGPIVE